MGSGWCSTAFCTFSKFSPLQQAHSAGHNLTTALSIPGTMATSNGWVSERAASPVSRPESPEPLVGKALLDKARALSNRPEDQIARACGYVGPSGRLMKKSFYRALVEAKGYKLSTHSSSGAAAKGRQADYRTRVHGNGNLLIGQAYTRQMGLQPGDEFRIELHKDTSSICLLPLEPGMADAAPNGALDDLAAEALSHLDKGDFDQGGLELH